MKRSREKGWDNILPESTKEDSFCLQKEIKCDVVVEESPELVTTKLQEVEREIHNLKDDNLKNAYFLALEEEIKQKTHYVRSPEFLLTFLRADSFNAAKAALRLTKFFKAKLDLFGLAKLPHSIVHDDLDENDRKVLLSGFIQHGGVDSYGRVVIISNQERLRDFANMDNEKNILRVCLYAVMAIVENNQHSQSKGFVLIRWNLHTTLPLQVFRIVYRSSFKTVAMALPIKFANVHCCFNSIMERLKNFWCNAILPPQIRAIMRSHDLPPIKCLEELEKHGINVAALPVTANGKFYVELNTRVFEELLRKDDVSTTIPCEQVRSMSCSINYSIQGESRSNNMDSKLLEKDRQCFDSVVLPVNSDTSVVQSSYESAPVHIKPSTTANQQYLGITEQEKLPWKLMQILQRNVAPDAIWWLPNGTAFAIEKSKFASNVLSKEFKGIKFDSFVRRLNRWGFRRLPDKVGKIHTYQHPSFQKNSPEILSKWDSSPSELPKKEKFPTKLMKLLAGNLAPDAIWWIADGKGFAVDTEKFLVVLEMNFDGMKMDSFFRMLRKWGFKRFSIDHEGESLGGAIETASVKAGIIYYRHALFQKDSPLFRRKGDDNLLLSGLDDPLENWDCLDALTQLSSSSAGHQQKKEKFPIKLYKILCRGPQSTIEWSQAQKATNSATALWWINDGNAFAFDLDQFRHGDILDKEFDGIKMSSFLRNLKRWGFMKVNIENSNLTGQNISAYEHPQFKEYSPHLLQNWISQDRSK